MIFVIFAIFANHQVEGAGYSDISCILDISWTKSCPVSSLYGEDISQTPATDVDLQRDSCKI